MPILFLPLAGSEYKDTYLYFFDLNAKITHKINDKNIQSITPERTCDDIPDIYREEKNENCHLVFLLLPPQ